MISIEVVVARVSGLERAELERWIANQWVRPDIAAGKYTFQTIDVARVRLIQELREEMEINDAALPVVLSLLDQIHDLRRRMRELAEKTAGGAPDPPGGAS